MTRLFFTIVVTFALISGTALAQDTLAERGPFGVGAMFGMTGPNPRYLTGVTAKYFLDETHAIDAAVLYRFDRDNDDWYIWADYLYHFRELIPVDQGEAPVYVGIGGRLKLQENDEDKFGIRFPVGVSYEFAIAPVDLFIEVVPIWDMALSYDFDLEGGIGLRYYF